MFNNVALDVVIGLVFIFLLYSLLATIIQELLATFLAFRAKILEKGIIRMLEDGKSSPSYSILSLFGRRNALKKMRIAAWFYAHPLIKYLGENNLHSKPSYLSAQNFSKVMLDLLKGFGGHYLNEAQQLNDSIQKGIIYHLPIDLVSDSKNPAIQALQYQFGRRTMQNGKGNPNNTSEINPDTRLFLQSIWTEAEADIDEFKRKLEKWFDDTMERTSGWYKKYTQIILLILGLILATAFNVDTIVIAKRLTKDPKLREQLVEAASNYQEKNKELAVRLSDTQLKKTDTAAYEMVKKTYKTVDSQSNALLDSARNMINGDIRNVNNLMGLGGWKWKRGPRLSMSEDQHALTMIIGWIITALAISLGAPFWFDLLSKLMKVRGAGTRIDSSSQNNQSSTIDQQLQSPTTINVNTQAGQEAVG